MSGSELLAAVLSLPVDQRADLARELLRSLDGEVDDGASDDWDAQIERRAQELKQGAAQTTSWEVVRARLLKGQGE